MPGFESLVRPFTSIDVAPGPGITTVPTPVDNAVLIATGAGTVKSGNYSKSVSAQWYADAQHMELIDFFTAGGPMPTAAEKVQFVDPEFIMLDPRQPRSAPPRQLRSVPRQPRRLAPKTVRGRWYVRY